MCFLRRVSEIIIVTNLKLHAFFKAFRMSKGGGGHQIWTMTDRGGIKNLTFCRTSFVNGCLAGKTRTCNRPFKTSQNAGNDDI